MIDRPHWLHRVEAAWGKRPIVWLTGVRRVGKTTLARSLSEAHYLNCDLPSAAERMVDPERFLRSVESPILVLDEVHQLPDPSRILKIAADEFPSLHVDLRSGDESRTSRALLRVARYRVFRHELAAPVADALGGASENTAIVACSVLGHFATQECVPPLLEGLDHPSVDVRRAAYDALRRATGADHGEHSDSWRAAGWSTPD